MDKLILLFLAILLVSCNSKAQNNVSENVSKNGIEKTNSKLICKQIVASREELNFFYRREKKDLAESKSAIESSYNEFNFFGGKMKGDRLLYADNRCDIIDAETLFEGGGLIDYLQIEKKSFDKLNLKFVIADEYNNKTEKHRTHTIKLNGKDYVAYDNDFSHLDWEISIVHFIEMLNDRLKLQKSHEKFCLVNSGDDSKIVLLFSEQYEFVPANYPNDIVQPKTLSNWKTRNG